jgi:hypothetical protein
MTKPAGHTWQFQLQQTADETLLGHFFFLTIVGFVPNTVGFVS